jgi:glycosyltransferase involved in cell wall biosynthesis
MLKIAVRKCKKIICISYSTALDVMKHTNAIREQIAVIYDGANTIEMGDTIELPHLPYFIYVGSWKPWKRVPDVIEAFENLADECNKENIQIKLLIIGKHDYNCSDDIESIVAKSRHKDLIEITGEMTNIGISSLIKNAVALVHPSEYEGFGMTLLESMAVGTPVIAVNCSSIPEVVGESAILVSRRNTKELTNAMMLLLKNPELRKELIVKGANQVKKFSWEQTAKSTLEILLKEAR